MEALERGRAAPLRPAERRERPPKPPRDERLRLDALRQARDRIATELGLPGSLLCTGAALREAAHAPPSDVAGWLALGLRRWQADLLAGPLRTALDSTRAS